MKDNLTICLKKSQDLEALANAIDNTQILDLSINYAQLIKKILNGNKEKIITEDSLKGEIYSILSKIFHDSEYFIWFDEAKKKKILKQIVEYIFVYYSKAIFTRSRQMKLTLNNLYKKKVFVIYPWIKEFKHQKKTFENRVFTNVDVNLPQNWTKVEDLSKADISILEFKRGLFNHSLPKIIFKSIEYRLPTIIIYPKPKTVNKIFKYINHVKVFPSVSELDFNYLEYFAQQNLKFKVPKKLRFKYNLSNFKKFINLR